MNAPLRIRKNILSLSSSELNQLRKGFSLLYNSPSSTTDTRTQYQDIAGTLVPFGHTQRNDLLFLPWARAYFDAFESMLIDVLQDPQFALPYWDYTGPDALAEGLPKIFTELTYAVEENGKSATLPNPFNPVLTYRRPGASGSLQTAKNLADKAETTTDFVTFSTQIWLADIENHIWMGGNYSDEATTAFDPVFWFAHCNLDRFWWEWQLAHPGAEVPAAVLEAALTPFGLFGEGVMHTAELGYRYDTGPAQA